MAAFIDVDIVLESVYDKCEACFLSSTLLSVKSRKVYALLENALRIFSVTQVPPIKKVAVRRVLCVKAWGVMNKA